MRRVGEEGVLRRGEPGVREDGTGREEARKAASKPVLTPDISCSRDRESFSGIEGFFTWKPWPLSSSIAASFPRGVV